MFIIRLPDAKTVKKGEKKAFIFLMLGNFIFVQEQPLAKDLTGDWGHCQLEGLLLLWQSYPNWLENGKKLLLSLVSSP